MIGEPGWLQEVPELVHEIGEGETDPTYRIIITGEGLESVDHPYIHGWRSHVYSAGMSRMKKHKHADRSRSASEALLALMSQHYVETQEAGTSILEAFGTPLRFRGDYRRSAEDDRERIQQ